VHDDFQKFERPSSGKRKHKTYVSGIWLKGIAGQNLNKLSEYEFLAGASS